MFAVGVALLAVGYALAYTGADKLRTKGGAPGLLYNLAISNDATPGNVLGASAPGGGPQVIPAAAQQQITPIAPAMPAPAGRGPLISV